MTRTPWRIQLLIYLLGFGCFYQQSVLSPVLPRLAGELGLSVAVVGLALSARFLVPALFAAQLGEWTSRFGLKRSLMLSAGGMLVTTPLYLASNDLWTLLLAQVVGGSFYMVSWIAAQTYTTRVPDRDWVVGIFATVTAVGMTVGPLVGGFTLDMGGYVAAFAAYAAGAALMAVAALALGGHPAGAPTAPRARPKGQLATLLARPGLRAAFTFSFICIFAISLRGNFLPVFLEDHGMSASTIGVVLAAGSLGQAAVRPFTRLVMRRGGLRTTMTLAALFAVVGLAVMPLTAVALVLVVLAFVHGAGAGLHQSLGLVLLADNTSDAERGYAVGLRATVNQVSSAGAPLLAGGVAAATGVAGAFYLIGGLLLLMTGWLDQVLKRAARPAPIAETTTVPQSQRVN